MISVKSVSPRGLPRRLLTLFLVVVAAAGLEATGPLRSKPAAADSWPADPNNPATPPTAAIDRLPTAQIDGVAWYQIVVGNTVYVAGKFTRARPAGSAPGANTVVRNNLLAYDLTTGALKSGFVANLNAQAFGLAASPDGSRIYVGGDFTTVNGVARSRIAAVDANTGALITSFNARTDSAVRAIVATTNTVYLGGQFTSVNSTGRARLGAVRATDGGLLPWAPQASDGKVHAMRMSPNADKIVVAGSFTTLNGSNRPGYGLGALNPSTGALLPFDANNTVRNAGSQSAILSLDGDSTNVYGTGYIFGTGGNLEGAFAANWATGQIHWIEDCHGDSYGVYPSSTAVYVAGHPHYCGNLGGFPNMPSGTAQRAVAFSRAATGTLIRDTNGYPSFTGVAAPSLLNFFPQLDQGSASGQSQAAWAVAGSGDYVVLAGEFLHVNGTAQQGLVRLANRNIAPNLQGPKATGTNFTPTLSSPGSGQVRINWTANYDYDNSNLTYTVFRDALAQPVYTTTRASTWWQRPGLAFTESGLAGGSHSYFIRVADPFGNSVTSPTVGINIAGSGNASPVASFTQSISGRTLSVDASSSSDNDGTVASYAWSWGDGQTGSGRTATHTYAAEGSYQVRLTVTDDDGASASTTKTVVIGESAVLASDAFGRTVSNGWGTADTGGPWTVNGTVSQFSVTNGQGVITLTTAGTGRSAYLGNVSAADTDVSAGIRVDKLANGTGLFVGTIGRRAGSSEYRLKIKIAPDGSVTAYISRLVSGTETTVQTAPIAGLNYVAGQRLNTRLQVVGTSPTTIRGRVWLSTAAEPTSWQVNTNDATSGLQTAGSVGVHAYPSGSATNPSWPVRFDDFLAVPS